MKTALRSAIPLLLLAAACTNPKVPEGHEGYIHHIPIMFGEMEHRDTLRGPASTGLSWRLYTTNIDMRAKTYAEDFQLLTRDNLRVSFEANTRIRLRRGSSKEVVEHWGGNDWYEWNVKEPLRTIVRETVTDFSATDIQLKTPEVGATIEQKLKEKYGDEPFEIISVAIGAIEFPKAVTQAIEQKIAKQEELKRQEFVLAKTRKEAAIHVLDALRQAEEQRIISETLNPLYLQKLAVNAYRNLASAPNKTVIMLPNEAGGTGLPLVLSEGERKILGPQDRQLLEDMKEKYKEIADKAKVPEDMPKGLEGTGPQLKAPGAEEEGGDEDEEGGDEVEEGGDEEEEPEPEAPAEEGEAPPESPQPPN